jgi:hypothetical protein
MCDVTLPLASGTCGSYFSERWIRTSGISNYFLIIVGSVVSIFGSLWDIQNGQGSRKIRI